MLALRTGTMTSSKEILAGALRVGLLQAPETSGTAAPDTLLQWLFCANHRAAVCREASDPGRLAAIIAELKAKVLPRLVLLLISSLNYAANPKVPS